MLTGPERSIKRARRLRSEMSLPEVLLWQELRGAPDGIKFRRQHPAGRFVADFYCHAARLVIEIDGEAHDRGDRPAADLERDQWFQSNGISVLRIPARQVLNDLDAVARGVIARAKELVAEHQDSPPTIPPLQGEVARDSVTEGYHGVRTWL